DCGRSRCGEGDYARECDVARSPIASGAYGAAVRRSSSAAIGACPALAFLLRRTICDHLRRSRLEKILNVFQRIHLRFFRACGLASGRTSFASLRRQCRTDSWPTLPNKRPGHASENEDVNITSEGTKPSLRVVAGLLLW